MRLGLAILLAAACACAAQDISPGHVQDTAPLIDQRGSESEAATAPATVAQPEIGSGLVLGASVPVVAATGFWRGFVNSVGMIFATELGDKTFFIAAIMAMKHSRSFVLIGAVGALVVMTVLSVAIGYALPNVIPRAYTHFASASLFLYFGVRMLWEAYGMYSSGEGGGPSEELQEVEEELGYGKADEEAGVRQSQASTSLQNVKAFQVASQAFTLTFLAEWGDRSQIATIALAAAKDPVGVVVGGCLGHSICTTIAVVGGRLLATRISEKHVALMGGVLFVIFGLHSLLFDSL